LLLCDATPAEQAKDRAKSHLTDLCTRSSGGAVETTASYQEYGAKAVPKAKDRLPSRSYSFLVMVAPSPQAILKPAFEEI